MFRQSTPLQSATISSFLPPDNCTQLKKHGTTLPPRLFVFAFLRKNLRPATALRPQRPHDPHCIEACVICDIDGYTGINDNPATGVAPPGFCTGTVHHVQWIAFIAGWDGTFRGKEMQAGVFAWFADVSFIDGKTLFLEGDVTLLR